VPADRTLAPSPFPGDDGRAAPDTRTRLAAAAERTATSYLAAVAALCQDRLLVPVVASTSRAGTSRNGLGTDKEAEMSLVLLQTADGRRAAVAFTGMDSLQAWRADARPVPVTLDVLARTTRAEGATALLVDPDGPYPLVIEGDLLDQLAAGHRLVSLPGGQFGWLQSVPNAE
jgi:SseB protein N-terminal domain